MIPLGQGSDHLAYEAEDGLIHRFRAVPDPVASAREARLLAVVSKHCPVQVPRARVADGHLVYPKLPGVCLLDRPGLATPRLVATFVQALHALQDIPLAEVAAFAGRDEEPPSAWLAEAAQHHAALTDPRRAPRDPHAALGDHADGMRRPAGDMAQRRMVRLALSGRDAAIGAFLAAPAPPASEVKVFSHNDFGAEHLLADPQTGAAVGIIDFGDAAVTDPAADFGRLYRDFGAPALALTPPALRERAVFYARCMVFEDLAYGMAQQDRRYVSKSVTALGWLFP